MKSGIVENIQQRFCQSWADPKPVEVNERPYRGLSWLSYPPMEPQVCCLEAAVLVFSTMSNSR